MYPGVIIEYDDQSEITTLPITEVRNQPLFAAVFTSDKGTEKWTRISGEDFFDMYGKSISFTRHGQPLLQAAMTINAGAELLCKRLVADDAALANIGIVATITATDGEQLATVKYSIKSAVGATTIEEAKTAIEGELVEGEYLLYLIADNGRGTSKKRIKIVPNYKLSRSLEYTLYTLTVLEGTATDESMTFSINPNLIVEDQNISLHSMISNNSTQLTSIALDANMDSFVADLAEIAGVDVNTMYKYDALFGCTNRGDKIENITIDDTGIDLQYTYGQMLQNGSNGAFGDKPIAKENEEAYCEQAVAALDGTFDSVIFNVDQHKIDLIVDANYPKAIKEAIANLAVFREDFVYMRDHGLGITSLEAAKESVDLAVKSKFIADYFQSYDIIDPYTKRQIPVTIGYDMAINMVSHCNNGHILPTAGIKYGMIIKNAIYGTLSFAPTICPDPIGNQKEVLDELHLNYASYIDNQLVVETLYTSQEKYSQWSFINNIMGIQEVVRAIRTRCPIIRYTFTDGEDLERYKADVDEVIAPFASNFKTLELEYVADATYSANKIFYAVLKVVYKDFVQTEWIKVTALNASVIEA